MAAAAGAGQAAAGPEPGPEQTRWRQARDAAHSRRPAALSSRRRSGGCHGNGAVTQRARPADQGPRGTRSRPARPPPRAPAAAARLEFPAIWGRKGDAEEEKGGRGRGRAPGEGGGRPRLRAAAECGWEGAKARVRCICLQPSSWGGAGGPDGPKVAVLGVAGCIYCFGSWRARRTLGS